MHGNCCPTAQGEGLSWLKFNGPFMQNTKKENNFLHKYFFISIFVLCFSKMSKYPLNANGKLFFLVLSKKFVFSCLFRFKLFLFKTCVFSWMNALKRSGFSKIQCFSRYTKEKLVGLVKYGYFKIHISFEVSKIFLLSSFSSRKKKKTKNDFAVFRSTCWFNVG